jgi:hypothetical protein
VEAESERGEIRVVDGGRGEGAAAAEGVFTRSKVDEKLLQYFFFIIW